MKIKFGDSSLNLKAGGSLANIDRGPRGYSAYEIAVQEGFVGTEEEWLVSLVGPEGKQGKDGERGLEGPRGKEGPEGKQGISGYTPVKGVDYFTEADIESLDIPKKTSDIQNDSGFIDRSVNNLVNYTLKTNTGSLIDLSIDNTNYVVTLKLKNQDGTIISTDTIDLPLESVVVGGSYDKINKKIVLTLENGNKVDIPVGDLIAGLQTEITSANKLASDLVDDTNSGNKFTNMSEKQAWNNKYDKPSSGIPATDLSGQVQTSLGKADTALQEHQDLTDYVKNTDYASANKGGVIRTANQLAVNEGGAVLCNTLTYANYVSTNDWKFISKGTLENVITGKELVDQDALVQSQEVQDANIEENASNIDWLQTLVNQMPHVAGQGTDLSLENVLNYRLMKFLPQGVSSQESTTGKNLLPYPYHDTTKTSNGITFTDNGDGSITINGTAENGSASFFLIGYYGYTNNIPDILKTNISIQATGQTDVIIQATLTESNYNVYANNQVKSADWANVTGGYIRILVRDGITVNNLVVKPYIVAGTYTSSDFPDYEPYTGGIPAPNPSYPYPVKVVTGENEINLYNKNLIEIENGDISSTTGENTTNANSMRSKNFIQYKENTMYYPSVNSQKPSNIFNIRAYNSNKEYIGYGVLGINGYQNFDINVVTSVSDTQVAYFKVRFATSVATSTDNVMISTSSDLSYVEHEEQNYQLSLGNIELNSTPDGTIRDGIYGSSDVSYNLFDKNNTDNFLYTYIGQSTGKVAKKQPDNTNFRTIFIKCKPNTKYAIKKFVGHPLIYIGDSEEVPTYGTQLNNYIYGNYSETIYTTSSNANYLVIEITSNTDIDNGYTIQEIIDNFQITEGSEVKPYAPYGQVGMWWKREYIGKVVLDGSEDWILETNGKFRLPNSQYFSDRKLFNTSFEGLICNYYKVSSSGDYYIRWRGSNEYNINIYNKDITSVIDFKTWLSTHNLIVDYELATPQDIPITDTTLINQLNDIYNNAHSYNGTTNITTTYEDGNEQMYLDIEALKNVWEVTE